MACEFSWLIGEVVGSSLTCGLLSWSLQPYDFLIPGNAVTEHGTLSRSVMSIHQNHLMDPLQSLPSDLLSLFFYKESGPRSPSLERVIQKSRCRQTLQFQRVHENKVWFRLKAGKQKEFHFQKSGMRSSTKSFPSNRN